MKDLSKEIVAVMLDEYGQDGLFARLADPFWFQALGCVLGYDWHSSGVTTVVTGVLKSVFSPEEHGIAVAGGKGRASRETPAEIANIGRRLDLSEEQVHSLQYSSKMSAKVDSAAIQAGYTLYHHAFFLGGGGKWLVIQQGMKPEERAARRYHWLSYHVKSYVVEPHYAIVGDKIHSHVLDMTAINSEGARRASVDLVAEGPERLRRLLSAAPTNQLTLTKWMEGFNETKTLRMPWRIDWKALRYAYEVRPRRYEELLAIKGIGPAAVRGLAFVSAIIYGESPSWRDPVKYSFAYGGKDGVPFPVNRRAMDSSIQFLREAVEEARVGDREKIEALRRLQRLIYEGP
jgi:hypothetical protein